VATFSKSKIPNVISALIVCIQKRFCDVDAGIFKCTATAQLETWPTDYQETSDWYKQLIG
jgi:hypothetical protein